MSEETHLQLFLESSIFSDKSFNVNYTNLVNVKYFYYQFLDCNSLYVFFHILRYYNTIIIANPAK